IVHSIREGVEPTGHWNSSFLAFSRDGKQLAFLSQTEAMAKIVDLASGRMITSVPHGRPGISRDGVVLPGEQALGLGFDATGKELWIITTDGFRSWSISTGRKTRSFSLDAEVYSASIDGRRIAVHSPGGSGEKTGIALIDDSGKRIARVAVDSEPNTTIATL